jgi:hypothetical protein
VPVAYLGGPPFLYMYRFHGANTFPRAHHAFLANRFCEGRHRILDERKALSDALRTLASDLPLVTMSDSDGDVFTVTR